MIRINETLKTLPVATINELNDLQGNFKELKEKQLFQMIASLVKYGFSFPFFVWIDKSKKKWIFDGHQRKNVISYLTDNALYSGVVNNQIVISQEQKAGFTRIELPDAFPYVQIQAANKKEAKEKLLIQNSQYGKVTKEGFDEFVADMDLEEMFDLTSGFEGFLDVETDINLDDFFEEKEQTESNNNQFKITLEYTEQDYNTVIEAFKKHKGTKEQVVFKLLGL